MAASRSCWEGPGSSVVAIWVWRPLLRRKAGFSGLIVSMEGGAEEEEEEEEKKKKKEDWIAAGLRLR